MKSKKIIFIGIAIIAVCLALVIFLLFASDIFGAAARRRVIKALKAIDTPDYVLINDNRAENYFGGEHIETDPEKCKELLLSITEALENAPFDGTRENLLGGFALIVRISEGEDEIKLWFYKDKIELENRSDIVICKMRDSTVFDHLLGFTE